MSGAHRFQETGLLTSEYVTEPLSISTVLTKVLITKENSRLLETDEVGRPNPNGLLARPETTNTPSFPGAKKVKHDLLKSQII